MSPFNEACHSASNSVCVIERDMCRVDGEI